MRVIGEGTMLAAVLKTVTVHRAVGLDSSFGAPLRH